MAKAEQVQRITNLLCDLMRQHDEEPDPQRLLYLEHLMEGAIFAADYLGLTGELLSIYRTHEVLERAARGVVTATA